MNNENYTYTVGIGDEERLQKHILINLTAHCDKIMNSYIKKETKKNDAIRRANLKHNQIVEKYLANQEKLIKKLTDK